MKTYAFHKSFRQGLFVFSLFLLSACSHLSKEKTKTPPKEVLDPTQAVLGFSHVNVVVDDMDYATEFYHRTLGFVPANNKSGPMYYKHVSLDTFARSAGFLETKVEVDIRFLVHPNVGVTLELMKYHQPKGKQKIQINRPNDLGGIRHVGFEVEDAVAYFHFLKRQPDVKMINTSEKYGPPESLGPVPIKFFYWVDPWGVHWEIEEGRPIGTIKGTQG